jgi:hypothetical protein
MGQIKIIAVPAGEAPYSVRQAWIGLTFPVAGDGRKHKWRSCGVLNGPKSRLAAIIWLILGKYEIAEGYLVDARLAVEMLSEKDRFAADWWKEHTPDLLRNGGCLLFRSEACAEVD